MIRVTGISSAAIGLSFETPVSSAAEDDEVFYGPPGPFVIGGTDGDAGLASSKSTPETLTTACHAASCVGAIVQMRVTHRLDWARELLRRRGEELPRDVGSELRCLEVPTGRGLRRLIHAGNVLHDW